MASLRLLLSWAVFALTDAGSCTTDDLIKIKKLPDDVSDGSFGGKNNKCGHAAYSIWHGTFDHKVFNECMGTEAGISSSCSECYTVAGDYAAQNCKSKCMWGWCKADCLACTAAVQQKAAECSGRPAQQVAPCLSEQNEDVIASSKGSCTVEDLTKIKQLPDDVSDGSFGGKSNKCGHAAYSIWHGTFDHKVFNECMGTEAGISSGCSECFAVAGDYAAQNCKSKCMWGWCKADCLACTAAVQQKAAECSGRPVQQVAPCLSEQNEDVIASSEGSCTAEDLTKIKQLPDDVSDGSFGGKSNKCGHAAYSIWHGTFDHKVFNECMGKEAGISSGCSECYAVAGEYAAQNCKSKCMWGWCKADCLACTSAVQQKAAECSGRPVQQVAPCSSDKTEKTMDTPKVVV